MAPSQHSNHTQSTPETLLHFFIFLPKKKPPPQGLGFIHVKIHTLQRGYLKCLVCQQFCLTSRNAVADRGAEAMEQNSVSIGRQSVEVGSHQSCSAHPSLAQPGSSSGEHRLSVRRDRVTLSRRGYLVIWTAFLKKVTPTPPWKRAGYKYCAVLFFRAGQGQTEGR